MVVILEVDIVNYLKGGNQFSTADIYKALGGKKSKDVRTHLDDLYKQGVVERHKVSNAYFWNLRDENDGENEPESNENVNNYSNFQNQLIKQLKDEIRFLRGTVSDLLKIKQFEHQPSPNATPTQPQLHARPKQSPPPLRILQHHHTLSTHLL